MEFKNKKNLKIVINDGLTLDEEVIEIASKLKQKLLASNANQVDKKRIGDEYKISHLTTQITIERKGLKPLELVPCNVCGCEYQNDMFKKVFVNYGGKNKIIKVCSENCQDDLISICGIGRAAKKKADLKPVRLWNQ